MNASISNSSVPRSSVVTVAPPRSLPLPNPPANNPEASPSLPPPRPAGPASASDGYPLGSVGADTGVDVLEAIRRGSTPPAEVHAQVRALPAAFTLDDFSLWYGQSKALHSVTMPIPRGQVAALIGPSGCGKSTLLRSLNRMNDLIDGVRVSGDIRLGDQSVYDRRIDVMQLRRRVGMVFQKPNPFPMSIYENIAYPLRIVGVRDRTRLDEVFETTLRQAALWDEVKDRRHQSALGLSGGQQQRLCIARAIAADPQVLLMDEPCSALDPIATQKVEQFIGELAARITVVIVTHNMQQAARVSATTAFMYMGRLVECGPTAAIFQNPLRRETEQYVTGRFG